MTAGALLRATQKPPSCFLTSKCAIARCSGRGESYRSADDSHDRWSSIAKERRRSSISLRIIVMQFFNSPNRSASSKYNNSNTSNTYMNIYVSFSLDNFLFLLPANSGKNESKYDSGIAIVAVICVGSSTHTCRDLAPWWRDSQRWLTDEVLLLFDPRKAVHSFSLVHPLLSSSNPLADHHPLSTRLPRRRPRGVISPHPSCCRRWRCEKENTLEISATDVTRIKQDVRRGCFVADNHRFRGREKGRERERGREK